MMFDKVYAGQAALIEASCIACMVTSNEVVSVAGLGSFLITSLDFSLGSLFFHAFKARWSVVHS